MLEEGLSARQVARRLNAQGVRPRKASLWRQSTVYTLLTNPAYAGMATYGKREPVEPTRPRHPGKYRKNAKSSHRARPRAQWLQVPVPALVGAEEQREVRECLARNKLLSPRNVRHGCGLRMECHHLTHRQRHPYEYHYYACQRRSAVDTGRAERCTARRVRAEELDAVVWKASCEWLKQPQIVAKGKK